MSPWSPGRVPAMVREGAVFVFFFALAAIATRPLAFGLGGQTLAGPDPLIDLWTVHWLSGHLLDPGQVFQGNIFHPSPHAVLYSDLSLGTAVLVAPFRALGLDPVPLFNLGVLLALAFSGWSFHALTRDVTGDRFAGLLSGVLAGFGSHQLYHLYHLNLLTTGWLALFLLGLHRLARQPTAGAVVLTAASFALTAQSSGYYAVAAAVLALLFAVVRWRALRDRRVAVHVFASGVLAAALVAPYAHAFLELREAQGLRRPPGMSAQMAFRPGQDLGSVGYLYRDLVGASGERLFPGLLSLVLAGVALLRRRPGTGFFAAATLVLLLISLGPRVEVGGHTVILPYAWLFAIPPLDSMRHPYTFAAAATFSLSVLAGMGWASFSDRGGAASHPPAPPPRLRRSESGSAASLSDREGAASHPPVPPSRRAAGVMVVALAWLETLAPGPVLRPVPAGVPPVYQRLAALPEGPALEVPVFAEETMLWAARHGRPVVNGIGAFAPFNTVLLERYVRNHWVEKTPEDVDASKPTPFLKARFPVRYVILPVGRRPDLRPLATAFDRSRSFAFVAEAADGDRIYELVSVAKSKTRDRN